MSAPTEYPELVLEAGRASRHYWRGLWRCRELLGFLAWRDITVTGVWYFRRMERTFADII